jgi:hypothetical protein
LQPVKVAGAVDAQHGLAIKDELLCADAQRCFGDPRKPLDPVMAALGEQANVVALAGDHEAKAVMLHLVKPLGG